MLLFEEAHTTARSTRQAGFPLYAVDASGNATLVGYTTKTSRMLTVPDGTVLLAAQYASNKGRRSVRLYGAKDGLPWLGELGWWNTPDDVRDKANELGIRCDSAFVGLVCDYLWRW